MVNKPYAKNPYRKSVIQSPDTLFCFMAMIKKTDPFYKGHRWEHLRGVILRRDGYKCQECRRYGKNAQATMVHHAIPRETFPELQYEPWNLVSLCNACHEKMHRRNDDELSPIGIETAKRALQKAGRDIGYLRDLEHRRTEETGVV